MKEDTEFQLPIQTSVDSQTMLWAKKTSRAFAKLMSYYRCAMLEMETRFNVLNEEYFTVSLSTYNQKIFLHHLS